MTTLADRETALSLAREAVEKRLAACVQVIHPITSVYRWEGEVREEDEALCVMKVPQARLDALVAHLRERHPYDTPEFTAVPSSFVEERYLAWVEAETSSAG
jgi:periplasmic divalent cation tolerance protein